ncbi:rhamnulokinase [candidate division KSB1 bacterium]|nr:rhamnulokinase [candidate division KSB1 bacterium]
MQSTQFIALDFGAGSGRVILATIGETIQLDEIHRFPNHQVKIGSTYHWDVLRLYTDAVQGLRMAHEKLTGSLAGIAVDTWGVDFGLLDKHGALVANPVCYRDARTNGMMKKVFERISQTDIYRATGIQFMQLNTLLQLASLVESNNPTLEIADRMLFMPDLISHFLTGKAGGEYTIASTSQMLNATTRQWDASIFEALHLPINIMPSIQEPGTIRGQLLPDIANETGLGNVDVIASASHDTAAAVAAVPAQANKWAYLSSGTWSLIGIETDQPIITTASAAYNFTNEGGVNHSIRFLRNVMGMWLLERCIRQWEQEGKKYNYNELLQLAQTAPPFQTFINPDDSSFLNPPNMVEEIRQYCLQHKQKAPETVGEIIRTILESLAFRYRWVLEKIEEMQGNRLEVLHIVGGGSQNDILNQFTANATGCTVLAGPVEATALGNVLVQALSKNVIGSLQEGRALIAKSFPLMKFEPTDTEIWDNQYQRIKSLLEIRMTS